MSKEKPSSEEVRKPLNPVIFPVGNVVREMEREEEEKEDGKIYVLIAKILDHLGI